MYKRFTAGFTMLEIVISVAILALIVSLSLGALSSFRERQSLVSEGEGIASLVRDARTRTLAGQGGTAWSVFFSSTAVILFPGTSYVVGGPNQVVRDIPAHMTLSTALLGGGSTLSFERLVGTTNQAGTISLSSGASTLVLRVEQGGVVGVE